MDWQNLIKELIATGMTQAEIARSLGIEPPSVHEILNSTSRKDVKWTTGNRLIQLHKKVMRKKFVFPPEHNRTSQRIA